MKPDTIEQEGGESRSGQDGSSALHRETKRVEDITQSKDRDRDDDGQDKLDTADGSQRADHDAAVWTMSQQAKEAGAGSSEAEGGLNPDG